MKKLALILLCLLALGVTFAASAEVNAVTATAALKTYHQVDTVCIEYSEDVVAPDLDGYTIVDYETALFKEKYELREFDLGVILAVYTNSEPARRADKMSVPGKYVIIELDGCSAAFYDEEKGIWCASQLAGIATNVYAGEAAARHRIDWSKFVVTQNVDVVNAEGKVVAAAGQLPALPNGRMPTPGVDERWTLTECPSYNGKYSVFFSISMPANYEEGKTYPLVVYCHGGSRALSYTFVDENGDYIGKGANVTWGPMGTLFLDEDVIYACPQNWKNTPAEWEMNDVQDTIALVEYIKANYPVDSSRVYAIGNSAGTMRISETLIAKPDLFTAYAQCNGSFMYVNEEGGYGRFTLLPDEMTVSTTGLRMSQVLANTINADNWRDEESIKATAHGLDAMIENRVALYFFDGTNTHTGSSYNTSSAYVYVYNAYKAMGMTDEEIGKLVRIYLADDEEYLDIGVCSFHSSTKVAVLPGHDVFSWLLSR